MALLERKRRVHFVGIGGIGMSGIAELLLKLGNDVSGSDAAESETVARLRQLGATVQIGHDDAILHALPPDVIVYSTAIRLDNPEMRYALEREIPVIRRAEMLAELMRLKQGVALAGSHGKTTTTGLTALLARTAGLDPTVVIGGRFDAIGSNAAWGGGQWLIAEADESDGSFLRLSPEIAVVTNIDREHMDHYGTLEAELAAFEQFLDRLPFYGRAILCSDCPRLRSLRPRLLKPRWWYGLETEHNPDFLVKILSEGASPEFEVFERKVSLEQPWLRVKLSVPGRHNVLNATAAALVARELGIAPELATIGLESFKGVRRRFELRGDWDGCPVYEDYAHHPTEIRATLAAARSVFAPAKPFVVFQPHRYTRTRDQWNEFSSCFADAEEVFTLPIYAAAEPREAWADNFDGPRFAENILGPRATACTTRSEILDRLETARREGRLKPGTPVFVLGAGDVPKTIPELLARKR